VNFDPLVSKRTVSLINKNGPITCGVDQLFVVVVVCPVVPTA
jgi:hypothetical protein